MYIAIQSRTLTSLSLKKSVAEVKQHDQGNQQSYNPYSNNMLLFR